MDKQAYWVKCRRFVSRHKVFVTVWTGQPFLLSVFLLCDLTD